MQYYDGDRLDRSNTESSRYLQLNGCGIQLPTGLEGIVFRRKGRVDYHIVYVLHGHMEVTYEGQEYPLESGDFVLYPPHIPQKYRDFPDTHRFFLHFTGRSAAEVLAEAGLGGGIYRTAGSCYLEQLAVQLVAEHSSACSVSSENGLMLTILSQLGKQLGAPALLSDRVEACAAYLVQHYRDSVTVEELAGQSHLSRSRFLYLFKQRYGLAPMEYQKQLRLNSCMTMLATTQLPVSEIGRLNGYDDPLYFSRVFRNATGLSPRAYRAKSENKGCISETDMVCLR